MTVKRFLATGVVAVVLALCVVNVLGMQGYWRPVGDRLVGSRIAWYCWDRADPRPHIEDAAYFDHPCSQDELPPVPQ